MMHEMRHSNITKPMDNGDNRNPNGSIKNDCSKILFLLFMSPAFHTNHESHFEVDASLSSSDFFFESFDVSDAIIQIRNNDRAVLSLFIWLYLRLFISDVKLFLNLLHTIFNNWICNVLIRRSQKFLWQTLCKSWLREHSGNNLM